jgi:hypothetical protein
MPRHRRLYRPEIIRILARFSRKHPRLSYPRFVIGAYDDLNPERTTNPDDNFSIAESISAWMTPKTIQFRQRISEDLRVYIDQFNRPDLYARRYCTKARLNWNKAKEHATRQIMRVFYQVNETHAASKRRAEYTIPVIHDYLKVVRGAHDVRQIDIQLHNGIDGLEQRSDIIQNCLDVRSVDRAIAETIAENNEIENGVA